MVNICCAVSGAVLNSELMKIKNVNREEGKITNRIEYLLTKDRYRC